MKWEVQHNITNFQSPISNEEIISILLNNRGIKTKKQKDEFLRPTPPSKISLQSIGLKKTDVDKVIKRIYKAKENKEDVVVYGDYDTDGVCATAILWETLYAAGLSVVPYIPSRFEEGYGLSSDVVKSLKQKNNRLSLIITVDNGIVANEAVETANKLGIDVIITDHHQKGKKIPSTDYLLHTTEVGGAGIAWFLARELRKSFKGPAPKAMSIGGGLELASIGTIADVLPLIGTNRSIVKYGLKDLNKTKRPGLIALFEEAGISKDETTHRQGDKWQVGTYDVGWVISPRINAMGRLEHAMDSLRLLCTTNRKRAEELARHIGRINKQRQDVVEEIVVHAEKSAKKKDKFGAIVIAHETYHEGIIGLAASRLVEKYYRPAVVFSVGKKISKASARSISGFNIIEAIHKLDDLIDGGGGHPMAAGFSIKTKNIKKFEKKFIELSSKLLTDELMLRLLKIDLEISFDSINKSMLDELKKFDPTGMGNPAPTFSTSEVDLIDFKTVGRESKHLKLKIEKNGRALDAIAFGMGYLAQKLEKGNKISIAYNLEENEWNGYKTFQLKVKDLELINLSVF